MTESRSLRTSRALGMKSLARVEGAGGLRICVDDGRVEIAEFSIYEPPRFFERLLRGREVREVPDIVARICGICPVAYQVTACLALEKALGVAVTPGIAALRRLLACAEWIQSHSLHIHLLQLPDFLGYESAFTLPPEHAGLLDRGFQMKAIGGRIIEVIGGRAVHPVNVTVGGFFKAPDPAAIRGLIPELEWGLQAARETLVTASRFDFPAFEQPYECVSLRAPGEYPMNEGRIVSTSGLDIDVEDYERHFAEHQVPHSTALHSLMQPGDRTYLCGPLARMSLCADSLPPQSRQAAQQCGIEWPSGNIFKSIVARLIEVMAAFEEALAVVRSQHTPIYPCRIDCPPGAGVGCHATEAPRGLLYQRYEIDAAGLIAKATIIPPTSQNMAQIESDLRAYLPGLLQFADPVATRCCEHLIRSYDPCISCAAHFLSFSRVIQADA